MLTLLLTAILLQNTNIVKTYFIITAKKLFSIEISNDSLSQLCIMKKVNPDGENEKDLSKDYQEYQVATYLTV